MLPRPITVADLLSLPEIDGTVESTHYAHVNRVIEETSVTWKLERRLLRQRSIDGNRLSDDMQFAYKQIVTGVEDGLAVCIDMAGAVVASLIAQPRGELGTLHLVDLRVDYDYRRQGLGLALACAAIGHARDAGLRAITAETSTQNDPAAEMLRKLAFEPAGVDAFRFSNHDLVKERAILLWSLPLE
ncbi:MAG TPA: GNAT family N-acetyltransferase [Tepidisphaeraceae bacterium]|nr:GNAT family N-acetyltransferase [Tepidisphaeraceae bacterium]